MPPKSKPRPVKAAKEDLLDLKSEGAPKKQPSARISAACEACKKRKTKCSGHPPPCEMCQQLDTPCVIDLSLDMRRRTALQRTMEESRIFYGTLDQLIDVLHGGDSAEIEDLSLFIKQNSGSTNIHELLHAKFQSQRNNRRRASRTEDRSEIDEGDILDADTDKSYPSSTAMQSLSKERSLPGQSQVVTPLKGYSVLHDEEKVPQIDTLASMYLPLLSKLRTASDWEATRMLHDFKTSPIATENIGALNMLTPRPSRNISPGRSTDYSLYLKTGRGFSPSRENWHASLQRTTGNPQMTGVAGFPDASWSSQWRNPDLGQMDIEIPPSASSSDARSSTRFIPPGQPPHSLTHQLPFHTISGQGNSHVVELFGDLRMLGAASDNQFQPMQPEDILQSSATIPTHFIQSRLIVEESPLSKVYTGFRDAARQLIATGTPPRDIVDGEDVVVDLLFRDRTPADSFTCSSWASELCRSFGDIENFAKLGWVFLLTRLMRWTILPTAQTYAELPQCLRPTPVQCFVPHMPAVDLHPIPAFRDMLCYQLQDWMKPMNSVGVSCNWPFSMEDALVTDHASGQVKISQHFAQHVSKSENWSLNSHALTLYPGLTGRVRIEDG